MTTRLRYAALIVKGMPVAATKRVEEFDENAASGELQGPALARNARSTFPIGTKRSLAKVERLTPTSEMSRTQMTAKPIHRLSWQSRVQEIAAADTASPRA
jgi:hypothetical protein